MYAWNKKSRVWLKMDFKEDFILFIFCLYEMMEKICWIQRPLYNFLKSFKGKK